MNINLTKSILFTKPLKKMPKGLIYHIPKYNLYELIETKKGKIIGEMYAYPEITEEATKYYELGKDEKTFFISCIKIEEKLKGWGKYFIDFAKKESYKQNCDGRIHLYAYNHDGAPHVFYWKQGFVTTDFKMNKLLKEYANEGVIVRCIDGADMFLAKENIGKKINTPKAPPKTGLVNRVKIFLGFN